MLARVTWHDAAFQLWEIPELRVTETVGWVVVEGPDFLVVSGEKDADGEYAAFTSIPNSLVISIVPLEEACRGGVTKQEVTEVLSPSLSGRPEG